MSQRPEAEGLLQRPLQVPLALALVMVLLVAWSDPALADTFTVKNTEDKGKGSLRKAISKANSRQGPDKIRFKIPGSGVKTIKPASPLPAITDSVNINGYTQPGASPNTRATGNDAVLKVQLNGTDAGDDANGLVIEADDSTIKGLAINRFGENGILVQGFEASSNKIQGNFVGTNAVGNSDLGNGVNGVRIVGADANLVGGTVAAARNVVSGNANDGVSIFDGAGLNRVEGNYVGTDKRGTADLGNDRFGVTLFTSADNTVGGTAGGARNVISGNGSGGVRIIGGPATGNMVEGNFVGTDAWGTSSLGNSRDGVLLTGVNNTIGGTAGGAGNRIAFNGGDGVSLFPSGAVGNSILSNSMFSNGDLGIDPGPDGVTTNDTDDPDTGANNLQNFPRIGAATRDGSTLTVSGTLNSNSSQSFRIECFLADGDPSGHGEGRTLVGEDTVTTNAGGDASFTCAGTVGVLIPGQGVTATATNTATGDTSEFSRNVPVG